jgi:hypothetical protein
MAARGRPWGAARIRGELLKLGIKRATSSRPVLLVGDRHLGSLLRQYQRYFNESRPHQGLCQRVPTRPTTAADPTKPIAVTSELGGLHIVYRSAA